MSFPKDSPRSIEDAVEQYAYLRVVCEHTFMRNGKEWGCTVDHKVGPIGTDSASLTIVGRRFIEEVQNEGWKIIDGKLHCPDCVDKVMNGIDED